MDMELELELCLFLVCHDEPSHHQAIRYHVQYPWIHPLRILPSRYMESEAWRVLGDPSSPEWALWQNSKYVGVFKYNFTEKYPFYDFLDLCRKEGDHWDLWTFVNGHEENYGIPNPSMLVYAGICHTLFPVIWYELFKDNGVPLEKLFSHEIPPYYSNAWIVHRNAFQDYLNFVRHIMNRMETVEPLRTLLHYNANYLQRMTESSLVHAMSVPYYTYHCFVLERLPCFLFWFLGLRWRPVGGPSRRTKEDAEPGLNLLTVIE